MFHRILRSTIVLAALIGAYQAYITFAVPRMEPSLALRKMHQASPHDLEGAAKGPTKYQVLLSNYFPKDHWTQVRPPKVFANSTEQTMLVIDEYKRHQESGEENNRSTQVDIKRFAMLMFPTPPHDGVLAPPDAIVLEAEQGARLLFDNFRPEFGKIGQITRGEFPGPITIRSDMKEAGPDDDLLVETSDLQMNTKLLYSANPVRFRMGQNVGGGRELEIRFLADEHVQPKESGLRIAGFDSLEIRREVRLRMQINAKSLLPGDDKKEPSLATASPERPGPSLDGRGKAGSNPSVQVSDAAKSQPPAPRPPIEVTCNGPFTFDFVRYVASVDRDVQVRQLNTDGPSDQLTCNQLDIHFAPKAMPEGKPEPMVVDPGKRQQRDLGRLEPAAIVAFGHPAIVVSPSRKAEARGDRIQIALRDQRLRIDGGNSVMLANGPNLLRAPVIDYQHPERDSASQIGRFRATGPGSLHFVADPKKPEQVFQAAWQNSVQLGREKGQPVIVMEGRPELAFAATGSIMADQLRLYLRELDGSSTVGLPIGSGNDKTKQTRLAPDRLIAVGHVEIKSSQLTGRTQQLLANFRIQPESDADPANAGKLPGLNASPSSDKPQQSYLVDADEMRLDVFLKGQTAVPSTLACDGNIVLREVPLAATDQQPLEIRGGQLFVDKLNTKAPRVTLKGASSTGGAGGAQVSGRGVTLLTDAFEMDGRDNRMWSDGPGEATLLMTRDMQGKPSATPFPVKITWQDGLKFDGATITFERDVVVAGMDSKLRCDRMLAKLAAPIQFGQHMNQAATNLSQIECEGKVTIENVSRNTGGVTSHDRMQLGRLTFNQQTGAITGQGPGVIRSTQFGAGIGPLAGSQGTKSQAAPPPGSSGSKLHFLRVDFHSGLDGNMYTRELTFRDRVRTVYGPVDSWEQELDPTRPQSLPPESITLSCDDLRLNEDPLAARAAANSTSIGGRPVGDIQMQAKGDVRIEGRSLSQGEFSIQANRASYEHIKKAFVLEGDTRTPAKLWRRTGTGTSPPLEARKIYFNSSTNHAKVEGIQYLEIDQSDVEKARKPAPGPTR